MENLEGVSWLRVQRKDKLMCFCNRFVLINHDDEPDDDRVNTCLRANGYRADIRKPFAGDSLGQLTDDLAMRLSEAFLHFCQICTSVKIRS